ncbi:hypothetical protein KDAU_73720 [Dictyobacter aurantiacus]|uniref:Uncharacterized protein n=1 Tax=Dictyobacter aurantiacus TaxID=1936993 RepID=A0A401ZT47_9CHLR|nr:hypothetical protein KDAU_73720 [Dictyobacter aurantiacus]
MVAIQASIATIAPLRGVKRDAQLRANSRSIFFGARLVFLDFLMVGTHPFVPKEADCPLQGKETILAPAKGHAHEAEF